MLDTQISILLVDDHAVVRAGYRHLLETQGGFRQVLEAENAQEAYAVCQKELPGLVICDISMPEPVGLSLIQRILGRWPKAKILMFTMHNSIELARACMEAGAKGYVTKSSRPEVLLRAIGEVLAGRTFISADLSRLMALSRLRDNRNGLDELSSREFEVLCLLVAGQSTEQIAELLFLSAKTIHNIHYQIKKKLQVGNDIELTKLAIAWGLTSPSIV
ncbi:LuxR family two component transcriptional regulator [Limnobacter thiooxidans]|uniref:Response regulator transcription factor n=1 Tax=Limnobacter thiooxidans TaxID=131080 RepID=A0AA86JI55_9BURK|nr:LuxR family two component transcriptional regulator [Limnobacter thiooxidans]BET24712.1 response regulator transcription factor [Limnobacter thiooxidans]